ncbi:MAG TPA: hypothetical protein EYP14_06685, partial [Planctomycetaceae bacterium]|nr:hypothetical protein [Planctomycetaceae bacterium]
MVDLRKGLPEGVIPRISLDELDQRGRYELVRVLFPLQGRNPEDVAKEVTPLLGPYGKCVPLPQTNQVLVTDRAGLIKTIAKVIESMPVPKKPEPPKPSQPPKPELAVYPVKAVDPHSLIEVIRILVPDVKLVVDSKTQQITAYAIPAHHAVIKKVLEQMEAGNPPDRRPRLQVYPLGAGGLKPSDARRLESMLELAVPDARLRIDTETGKLIVWATPDEHQIVQTTLKQMGRAPAADGERKLQLYRLGRLDPQATVDLLKELVPAARLILDDETKSLVAVGDATQQQTIQSLLDQLGKAEAGPNAPKIQVYPLSVPLPEDAASLFEKIVPQAEITIDSAGMRLIAFAVPSDQEKIKSTLDEIEKSAASGEPPRLVIYRVGSTQVEQIKWLLDSLIGHSSETARQTVRPRISAARLARLSPRQIARLRARGLLPPEGKELAAGAAVPELFGVKVIADAQRGELAVWARPDQHKIIAGLISELKGEGKGYEEGLLRTYPVVRVDVDGLLELFETAHPDANIVYDKESQRLLVWASASTHAAIKKSLDELQGGPDETGTRQVRIYPLEAALPSGFSEFLTRLLPYAQITVDQEGQRLIVMASPKEHETIRKTLEELQKSQEERDTYQIVVYRVVPSKLERVRSLLERMITEAGRRRLSIGSTSPTRKRSETAGKDQPAEKAAPKPVDLQGVKVLGGERPGELIVWARPDQHALIAALIRQFQAEADGEGDELVAYSIKAGDLSAIHSLLESLYPDAKFVVDAENRRILAWAPTKVQQSIRKSLDQMQVDKPGENQPRFESYPLYGVSGTQLMSQLQTLVPDARLMLDDTGHKLIAWGTPEVQAKLKAALAKLQQGVTPETTPQLEVYPLTKLDPTSAQQLLQNLVPNAKLTYDAKSRRLIALAVPADQQVIRSTLEQLQPTQPGPDTPLVRFYPVTKSLPSNIASLLTRLVPEAQISVDEENKQLVVIATAADHQVVKSTLEEMEKSLPPAEERQLIVYPLTPAQRKRFDAIFSSVSSELPGIKLIPDDQPGSVSIWAKPSQHKVIAEIIQQLQTELPETNLLQLVAYPLKVAEPKSVQEILQTVFPNAKIVVDEESDRLLIWTTSADHERIKTAIEQLDSGRPDDRAEGFQVYPVRDVDPQLALQIL